ncbi:MAG TPA: ABC transporter ATP-binding protein [Acidimicrobiales bacterium]|nr:ABC transporter ATP-binding protein [Acidimicrobiales bacterium]
MTTVRARDVGVVLGGCAVLSAIDLEVAAGEWLSIVGPNGAGKSTLLRAIAGLVDASGTIEVGGADVRGLTRRGRARQVALVPQAPVVPPGMTVGDYVLLGRTPHLGALGAPGGRDLALAHDVTTRLDLDGFVDRALSSLSGGERQRAFLARALTQAAPVLLLDEPTTALDVGHQQQVLDLIDALRRDGALTVLSTMHDLTLAGQYADRLALLDAGRMVSVGTPGEVLTEANVHRYYGARVRVVNDGGRSYVLPYRAVDEAPGGTHL